MDVEIPAGLSPYEQQRWDEIQLWKENTVLPRKVRTPEAVRTKLQAASDRVGEAWNAVPGNVKIETWIAEAINGGFHMTIDAVSTTVREERIVRKVDGKADRPVRGFEDFLLLDLKPLDRARPDTKGLRSVAAAGHGAASGFVAGGATAAGAGTGGMGALPAAGVVAGLAVADAVALVGGMLQGTALIGAHYGFDPRRPSERAMLMTMLGAGAAREAAKVTAMMKVRDLALALAAKQTIAQLSQRQLFNLMRRFYALLLLKTTKKNIAKGVPVLGAGLGAGLNYAASRQVLDTAQHLYPERFLLEKYPTESQPETSDWTVTVEQVLVDEEVDDADRGILERLEELPASGSDSTVPR